MKFKIFVSYSTHDIKQVDLLKSQLTDTPIEVFIAEHSVSPSQELAPTISNAISGCDLFVLLWSRYAQNSEWVSQEIGKASALKKKILPLILDKDLKLPGFISNLKYLAIYEQQESLKKAQKIIIDAYNSKKNQLIKSELAKQKEKDTLVAMGAGAFLLWVLSK
ncbi:toll/interleukin-1 receptor domain-containing protein [Marinagarivorans algicola]|uniref:toll/interleukin-1 receptor domain-containing protein n=1 Tax=Marinagarivorans algicola TaxID=1513270 RepID=UPI003735A220